MSVDFKQAETVYEVLKKSAERYCDNRAVTYVEEVLPEFVDKNISFRQLLNNVHRVARVLKRRLLTGTEKRGVVSILMPNIPQTHYVLWGSLQLLP